MKNKPIAVVAATLLSVGLVAAPTSMALAGPPDHAGANGHVMSGPNAEARQVLKDALREAREAFVAAVKAAQDQFRADTAEDRAALKAVLTDQASTTEQKRAALDQFRADTADARQARKAAMESAMQTWKAARLAAREAFRAAIA